MLNHADRQFALHGHGVRFGCVGTRQLLVQVINSQGEDGKAIDNASRRLGVDRRVGIG